MKFGVDRRDRVVVVVNSSRWGEEIQTDRQTDRQNKTVLFLAVGCNCPLLRVRLPSLSASLPPSDLLLPPGHDMSFGAQRNLSGHRSLQRFRRSPSSPRHPVSSTALVFASFWTLPNIPERGRFLHSQSKSPASFFTSFTSPPCRKEFPLPICRRALPIVLLCTSLAIAFLFGQD